VARYGEFVLLNPRFKLHTLLLWLVMPVVLLGGVIALWRNSRKRQLVVTGAEAAAPLSADERARLARLIDTETPPQKSV
jgi:cytochrome c-type biogenesis protein CcmH